MRSLRQCMTSRGISAVMVLLLALMAAPGAALAQVETGSITGTVSDPQGAVVTGAAVTVTSSTGATRSTKTSGDGSFNFSNLNPGRWEVKVEGAGFGTRTATVDVSVGTRTTLDVQLEVTTAGETVDVIAGEQGIQVNTENQTLQTVVSERELKELPTITRNPYALVQLSGNVSPADPSGRGAGFAINGQRAASTNILLDGADNNDTFTAVIGQDIPLDAVQEFSVLTNNFSAEFGRAGGGIVNVATKAGTNEFHGTVYEFNRISRLASRGYDLNAQYPPEGSTELPKGVFTRNQFGYSIGGPIVEDKLLFFNSIEWIRVRSGTTATILVPTPEFIAQTDAATQAFFANYSLTAPISGRLITRGEIVPNFVDDPDNPNDAPTPTQLLPSGLPIFGEVFLPLPADAGAGAPQNQYQLVGRVDWNINDKTTMYARYALQDQLFFEGSNAFSPYQGFNTGVTNFNNNFLASLTRVWSDSFVSQTKFVFNRLNNDQPLGEQPPGPTLYFASTRSSIGGVSIALPGYLPFNPGSAIPFGGPQNLAQFFQDQTWTLGDHTLRFGGSFVRIQDDRSFGAYQNAVATLGTSLTSGLNNLVLGRLRRFQVAVDPMGAFPGDDVQLPLSQPQFFRNNRYNEGALYVNDSWKIHPRVTLNLGLRWDYFGVQHNKDPRLDSNFYFGEGSTILERIQNGRVFIAEDSPTGSLWQKDKDNFGPRVGIAWDVFGDGKTSLRGGYGISYERNFGNVTFNVIQNPPNYAVLFITAGDPGFPTIPISGDNLGPFATGTGTRRLPATSLRHVREDIETAYAHFWSAAIEHEIMGTAVASIEYSGSKGVKLYSIEDINGPFSALGYGVPFDPVTNPTAYVNPQYASINTRGNGGFSNYNGLTFGIDTRQIADTGLQFQAKYTWSHTIDNLSSTFSDSFNNFNLGLLDPFNPELDKGNADFDVRHRFVSSGIWDIPFANDTEGIAKHVLDGWQITYIYTARTGAPYTIFDCTNGFFRCVRLLQAGPIDTGANSDPREAPGESPNQFVYLDLTNQASQVGSYIHPDAGTNDYGPFPSNMTARNNFRRPGFWNLDGGIYKNIDLTERYSIQLRAEFYNVFNHANLFIDESDVDVSDLAFGAETDRITAFRDGRRQVQLAIKFIF
jgi:hypothetical protein